MTTTDSPKPRPVFTARSSRDSLDDALRDFGARIGARLSPCGEGQTYRDTSDRRREGPPLYRLELEVVRGELRWRVYVVAARKARLARKEVSQR